VIAALALAALAVGQASGTGAAASAPAPDPAPVTEGNVTEAHLAGMTVLVKRLPGAELVTTQLHVRGGARNWGAGDAGVEALAFRVATTGGTRLLDKEAFGRRLAALGSQIDATTGRDASVLQGKGPLSAFEETFGLLADCFLAPALPESEVTLARGQTVLALQRQQENPDGALGLLVEATVYKGHPYANRPDGTPETVGKLTRPALAAHLAGLRHTTRLVLVVVGDVGAERVLALARKAFAEVPRGEYAPAPLPRPGFAAASLTTEARKLPTNYLQAMFVAPGPGAPDYPAARVATFALGQRLFEEVRTKRNLSYAPGARYEVAEGAALGGIYVSAVDPDVTLPVMLGELTRLKDEAIPADELGGYKSLYRTRFLMSQETTDGQATSLARGLLQAGDWRYFDRLLAGAAGVTAAEVQAYARTYAGKLQFVLLGDPARLDPRLTGY
jgi:predicted Zn-dependent peptidase